MQLLQLKGICQINRVMLFTYIAVTLYAIWERHALNHSLLMVVLLGVHVFALFANEFFLKTLNRQRSIDDQILSKLSVLLPFVFYLYNLVNYAVLGQLAVYLMGFSGLLQAQFLGAPRVGNLLGWVHLAVFGAGLMLGYPKVIPHTTTELFIQLIPAGVCLYYYGNQIGSLVTTHMNQLDRLQSMAATDALTGLTNRRQFNSRLHSEISRARRHETTLALALFDIDDFKRLNDFYGHQVGDRILKELGKLILGNIRDSDIAARYGGEEFALILPETTEIEAYELLERLRTLVSQTVFCLPENPITITISVGVAQLDAKYHTTFELVELSDTALYEAKNQGKNQVIRGSSMVHKILLDSPHEYPAQQPPF